MHDETTLQNFATSTVGLGACTNVVCYRNEVPATVTFTEIP
jgi:hypothetical protein